MVLEVEAERLILIGADTTAVLPVLRADERADATIYHFGGIAGEIVYKGTLTVPNLELRVRGSGERLRIDIAMNCDGHAPLRLF